MLYFTFYIILAYQKHEVSNCQIKEVNCPFTKCSCRKAIKQTLYLQFLLFFFFNSYNYESEENILVTVARGKDKQLLINEVVTLKTEKDRLEQELNHKDNQLLEAKSEIDKSTIALKNSERQIQTLKAQVMAKLCSFLKGQ